MSNVYSSGDYYEDTYVKNPMDIKQSTKWMTNYFVVVKDIFPEIIKNKNKSILEIGSGFGGFVNVLNKRGFSNVIASDMSNSIFSAELSNKHLTMNLVDDEKIESSYDIVFAFDVMEHINETQKAVEKLKKMLNKDGLFIFCTPYPIKKHLLDNYHTNMQFPNYYTNIFKQNGFELVSMQDVSFFPFLWRFNLPFFLKFILKSKLFISETFFIFKRV